MSVTEVWELSKPGNEWKLDGELHFKCPVRWLRASLVTSYQVGNETPEDTGPGVAPATEGDFRLLMIDPIEVERVEKEPLPALPPPTEEQIREFRVQLLMASPTSYVIGGAGGNSEERRYTWVPESDYEAAIPRSNPRPGRPRPEGSDYYSVFAFSRIPTTLPVFSGAWTFEWESVDG